MERCFRSRYGRMAVMRAALLVFVPAGALIGAVVFTLDLNARRSNHQQAATELASMARVSASTFSTMRANLRARVGELAASAPLQQAVLERNTARLRSIARSHNALIVLHGHAVGTLPAEPRIAATATMASGGRGVAPVAAAAQMDPPLLALPAAPAPLPKPWRLVLA